MHNISFEITSVKLFLLLGYLLVKSSYPINHFIQNAYRNSMVNNLKETPFLTSIANFVNQLCTKRWPFFMASSRSMIGTLNFKLWLLTVADLLSRTSWWSTNIAAIFITPPSSNPLTPAFVSSKVLIHLYDHNHCRIWFQCLWLPFLVLRWECNKKKLFSQKFY